MAAQAGAEPVPDQGRDPLKVMCNRLSKLKDGLITPEDSPGQVEAMIAAAKGNGTPVDPDGLRASARVGAGKQLAEA